VLGLSLLAGLCIGWNPQAGLVEPLAKTTRTISVTSNEAAKGNIIDGNDQTQWQSWACFPTGFIGRADMNVLLNICTNNPAACTTSAGSKDVARGFDNNFYTGNVNAELLSAIRTVLQL
jgi:serine/threonine-protein kinase ATR